MLPLPKDKKNSIAALLGVFFIIFSLHDYYGVLKIKGEFGLIDFTLFLIGLNLLIATTKINQTTPTLPLLLTSTLLPFTLPLNTSKFPYELTIACFWLATTPGMHSLILKRKEIWQELQKLGGYTKKQEPLLKKRFARLPLLLVPIIIGIALYQIASKEDMLLGADYWWHYTNIKTIYETGKPIADPLIFDNKFLAYPFFSHFFAAVVSKVSGLSIIDTITVLSYLAIALTALIVYYYSSRTSGTWYAIISLSAFMFLYFPTTDIRSGRFAQIFGTLFGLLSIVPFLSYEKYRNKAMLSATAILVAITVSTHWLMGFITVVTYFFYIHTYYGRKATAYFFSVFFVCALPYLFFLINNLPVLLGMGPLYLGGAKKMFLIYEHIGNIGQIQDKLVYRLSAIGLSLCLIGFLTNRKAPKKRIITAFVATTTLLLIGGYIYPIFYFARLFDYLQLFLILFIGDGAKFIVTKLKKYDKTAVSRFGVYLILASFLLYLPLRMEKEYFAPDTTRLGAADESSILWIKENLGETDVVATNVRLTKSVYGFTTARPAPQHKLAGVLKDIYGGGDTDYGGFVLINAGCGFHTTPTDQDFEGSTANVLALKDVSCSRLLAVIKKRFEIFFEVDNTILFRVV